MSPVLVRKFCGLGNTGKNAAADALQFEVRLCCEAGYGLVGQASLGFWLRGSLCAALLEHSSSFSASRGIANWRASISNSKCSRSCCF